MESSNLMIFFIQICCMLGAAFLFGQIIRLFNQPAIIGEIIGGIILGPTVIGTLFPNLYGLFFSEINPLTPQLDSFIQFGMILFMFSKGLEIEFGVIRKRVKCVAFISIMGILIPFLFGVIAVLTIPFIKGTYISAFPKAFPIFIGTALSISALPVILRILGDLKLNKTELGIIIVACAAISDLVGWTVFSCITSELMYTVSIKNIFISIFKVIFFLVIALGIVPKVSKVHTTYRNKFFYGFNRYIGVTIIAVLLGVLLGEALGIHPFFSAFVLGIALRDIFNNKGRHRREITNEFSMNFFAPLYFASIGLKVNFIKFFDVKLVIIIIIIAYLGKILGAGLGALIGGMKVKQAISIGVVMNARGAVEIMLASTALEFKLIDNRIFVALVVMAIITSLTSAPLLKCINKKNTSLI